MKVCSLHDVSTPLPLVDVSLCSCHSRYVATDGACWQ